MMTIGGAEIKGLFGTLRRWMTREAKSIGFISWSMSS